MSRIEHNYCFISTSYLVGLFGIFILLHIWQYREKKFESHYRSIVDKLCTFLSRVSKEVWIPKIVKRVESGQIEADWNFNRKGSKNVSRLLNCSSVALVWHLSGFSAFLRTKQWQEAAQAGPLIFNYVAGYSNRQTGKAIANINRFCDRYWTIPTTLTRLVFAKIT